MPHAALRYFDRLFPDSSSPVVMTVSMASPEAGLPTVDRSQVRSDELVGGGVAPDERGLGKRAFIRSATVEPTDEAWQADVSESAMQPPPRSRPREASLRPSQVGIPASH